MIAAAQTLPNREAPAAGPTRPERLGETARRTARAQAILGHLAHLLVKASATKGNKDHADGWQFREGEDFTIPEDADYDPASDVFNPAWLIPEQRRLVAVVEAVVARVEFFDRTPTGRPRVIMMRAHLI